MFSTTEIISNGKKFSIGHEKLNRVHDNFSLAAANANDYALKKYRE